MPLFLPQAAQQLRISG
uniref:Uncharacterized protein n=1 Tax=Rhizophora mucronata TaxID=61149 RepID=A0A2P2NKF8_RHIMU